VTASSSSSTSVLSYQWHSCDSNGGYTHPVSGAISSTFAIPTNLSAGTYYYCVKVSGDHNEEPIFSSFAVVTVNAAAPQIQVIDVNTRTGSPVPIAAGTYNVYTNPSSNTGSQFLVRARDNVQKSVTYNNITINSASSQALLNVGTNDSWWQSFNTATKGQNVSFSVSAGEVEVCVDW